jgi:hypothetical protein
MAPTLKEIFKYMFMTIYTIFYLNITQNLKFDNSYLIDNLFKSKN